jgi:hypothetical protein
LTFKLAYVLTFTLFLTACGDGRMSPYEHAPREGFLQGATWEPTADLAGDLTRMRDDYFIDTVSIYGLETWAPARLDELLAALTRLDMRLVVRIEAYDPLTFAFRAEDAEEVLARHRALLARLPAERVAYLAVNMPVDDPRVQARLGGVNSPLSVRRQIAYARTIVGLARPSGFKVFLGVFYGWDGGYQVPSYQDSGADGYVLTNYSYPSGDLIDRKRIGPVIDRAIAAQPGSPIVVEYGFQTRAAQNDDPDQTAGLVSDVTEKRAALRATTHFYRSRYPAVIGTIYFGYNVFKMEGDPPRRLDYGLVAPPMPP